MKKLLLAVVPGYYLVCYNFVHVFFTVIVL